MSTEPDDLNLPAGAFARLDETPDEDFYAPPRLVHHIDHNAIVSLTAFYRKVMPPGGALIDLMSSWVSYLPPEVEYREVVGHGMNAEELAANPRLNRLFVQYLNHVSVLTLADLLLESAMI
ncbi:MAG: hypothetical protein ACREFB_13690 [Stellaceae bacterium]